MKRKPGSTYSLSLTKLANNCYVSVISHFFGSTLVKLENKHGITCEVFSSINDCQDQLVALKVPSVLLSSAYLKAIESSMGENMQFRYLLFFQDSQIKGFSYCQIHPFSARESFKVYRQRNGKVNGLKSALANWVNFRALVAGNLLLTGPYGYFFDNSIRGETFHVLLEAWQQLFEIETKKDNELSVVFIKDFIDQHFLEEGDKLETNHYFKFSVQPSMLLSILPEWSSREDYFSALKSKYRIRLRQAIRKRGELVGMMLEQDDIFLYRDKMQSLLNQVLDESDFRIVHFDIRYLIEVKKNLGDLFEIKGYFLQGELVGFMSYFRDGDKILAHFTGFDVKHNRQLDLYLNMLLDLVEVSITSKVQYLDLSRTAMEIKSSIGASPQSMVNFLKHRSMALNRVLPKIFNALYQSETWVQRHPFR